MTTGRLVWIETDADDNRSSLCLTCQRYRPAAPDHCPASARLAAWCAAEGAVPLVSACPEFVLAG